MEMINQKSPYKNLMLLTTLILIIFSVQCSVKNRIIKRPKPNRGKVSEFHREAKKFRPVVFGSYNQRGVQVIGDRPFNDNLGVGIGTFYNVPLSNQWVGHKLFYLYFDFEVSQEAVLFNNPYPGGTKANVSTNPGIFLRHWIPMVKIFYGMGLNARLLPTEYDSWGIYGQAGIQISNAYISGTVIAHPGQTNMEMEYRVGWMF